APATEPAEDGSTREGARRRGRRGGQRERQRRENTAQGSEMPAIIGEIAAAKPAAAPDVTAQTLQRPAEYVAYPEGWTPPVTPSEYIAMPATMIQQEVTVMATPSESPAPVAESVPGKISSLAVASSDSGLVQIETDPGKLQAIANIPAGYADKQATRRRTRQREVYVENEPLVQIETQRPQA
ncbi:MAG: hypothetical protein OEV15_10370, partial [Gallionella sp.]|nr:hypothetical protein [Gallionella sp.]